MEQELIAGDRAGGYNDLAIGGPKQTMRFAVWAGQDEDGKKPSQ